MTVFFLLFDKYYLIPGFLSLFFIAFHIQEVISITSTKKDFQIFFWKQHHDLSSKWNPEFKKKKFFQFEERN